MKWYGPVPEEIKSLFDINIGETSHGFYVLGIYVQLNPRYKPSTPDWMEKGK